MHHVTVIDYLLKDHHLVSQCWTPRDTGNPVNSLTLFIHKLNRLAQWYLTRSVVPNQQGRQGRLFPDVRTWYKSFHILSYLPLLSISWERVWSWVLKAPSTLVEVSDRMRPKWISPSSSRPFVNYCIMAERKCGIVFLRFSLQIHSSFPS